MMRISPLKKRFEIHGDFLFSSAIHRNVYLTKPVRFGFFHSLRKKPWNPGTKLTRKKNEDMVKRLWFDELSF